MALRRLIAECDRAPGTTSGSYAYGLPSLERVLAGEGGSVAASDSLCAADPDGRAAALAWVRVPASVRHQYRGLLLGAVHPNHRRRGLGTFLLSWADARAAALLRALPDDRTKVLRIEFPGRRDDAVPLYERRGFALHHVELEMERDLRSAIPEAPLPAGLALAEWSPDLAPRFYETCVDAFSDRPGPMWTQDEWVGGFGGGALRADLSWLALAPDPAGNPQAGGDGREGVGYVLCDVRDTRDGGKVGAVRQVGVRPRWRGRGVASALLCAAMRAFRAEGAGRAVLDVNVDNPRARRVYERLGFVVTGSFTVYTKPPRDES
jgi:ribosomal protein S18 acetylase RimI-like enzyme